MSLLNGKEGEQNLKPAYHSFIQMANELNYYDKAETKIWLYSLAFVADTT